MTHWIHVFIAFTQYFSLTALIGGLTIRHIRNTPIPMEFSAIVDNRVNKFTLIALSLLSICAFFVLAIRATMMTGSPVTEILPALPLLLLHTHYGLIWLIRAALLVISWGLVIILIKTNRQWVFKLLFIIASLIIWTVSAAGHASGWNDFSWQQLNDWLHIFTASLWVGSIVSTLFVILPLLSSKPCQDFIKQVSLRLSRLATKVFILVIITGLINLYLQLSKFGDLVTTAYGQILAIKIMLVLMMLYFAFINRYFYLSQFRQKIGEKVILKKIAVSLLFFSPKLRSQINNIASRHFFQILMLETFCLVIVLICTSILRHGPPPPHIL